jgi:hypothetical protein
MKETPTPQNQIETKKEKTFLYHMVPADMQGNVLHPLNSLKDTNPELYLSEAKKYDDRKHVMEQFIPTLECAWNDVLHFSAINPAELKQELLKVGMNPREMKFYQIDPSLLDPKQTTIYLYQEKASEDKMNPKNFAEYDPEKLGEHSALSQVTKDYYKEKFGEGERPLLFVGVPHILHKGSIDVSDLPVIVV